MITSFVIPEDSRVRLSFWPRETEELHLDIVVTHSGEYPYEGTDCPGMGGQVREASPQHTPNTPTVSESRGDPAEGLLLKPGAIPIPKNTYP